MLYRNYQSPLKTNTGNRCLLQYYNAHFAYRHANDEYWAFENLIFKIVWVLTHIINLNADFLEMNIANFKKLNQHSATFYIVIKFICLSSPCFFHWIPCFTLHKLYKQLSRQLPPNVYCLSCNYGFCDYCSKRWREWL